MAESTKKIGSIISVVVISSVIMVGTGIGIWLGVKTNLHPEPGWTLALTGNIAGGNTTIIMSEILLLLSDKAEYEIRTNVTNVYLFQGVILASFFQESITINPSAENVTFIGADEYQWTFPISEILNNDTYILAYMLNNHYIPSFEEGGNGYLWLIVPNYNEFDSNGERCVKSVVEIYFE